MAVELRLDRHQKFCENGCGTVIIKKGLRRFCKPCARARDDASQRRSFQRWYAKKQAEKRT